MMCQPFVASDLDRFACDLGNGFGEDTDDDALRTGQGDTIAIAASGSS
jgi:hypothetical protein